MKETTKMALAVLLLLAIVLVTGSFSSGWMQEVIQVVG